MVERSLTGFDLYPAKLIGDIARPLCSDWHASVGCALWALMVRGPQGKLAVGVVATGGQVHEASLTLV
jgi:hypothetical protein